MFTKSKSLRILTAVLATTLLASCGEDKASFSILSTSQDFSQSVSSFNNKIDIIWVIDNSGSMQPVQQNIASNFSAFIQDFATKGYDFRMVVITTDAWVDLYGGSDPNIPNSYENKNKIAFRQTTAATGVAAGMAVLTPDTPNLDAAFTNLVSQGISGYGDERAFQSLKASLEATGNSVYGFPRSDAFMAVIVVSDEDDFSGTSSVYPGHDYNAPGTYPLSFFTGFLDNLRSVVDVSRRTYNVSSVSVLDQACLDDPITSSDATISLRYNSMVSQTRGIGASICSAQFSTDLARIATNISVLSTRFLLNRVPIVSSIRITVNGVLVANDATNGWTYDATANAIEFHGTAVPQQGATISVDYDPAGLAT